MAQRLAYRAKIIAPVQYPYNTVPIGYHALSNTAQQYSRCRIVHGIISIGIISIISAASCASQEHTSKLGNLTPAIGQFTVLCPTRLRLWHLYVNFQRCPFRNMPMISTACVFVMAAPPAPKEPTHCRYCS
jgi:hypothetical protein